MHFSNWITKLVNILLRTEDKMKRNLKRKLKPRAKEIRGSKDKAKRARREKTRKIRDDEGENACPKKIPRTIENTREPDDTYVLIDDEEVIDDERLDDMASYFDDGRTPKILITTSPNARVKTWKLCFELKRCIPNSELYSRKSVAIKRVIKQANEKEFTDLIVIHEDKRTPNGIALCHLPNGPTGEFYTKNIKGAGESTDHFPELIMNNFQTRLGHTIGRMFKCLFPQNPEFVGRRVITIHNQRDYIFFRHHRYEFKNDGKKAALHELGPRFTLRLKWLQKTTYDTRGGEYEWVLKRHEMETSRRRFFL